MYCTPSCSLPKSGTLCLLTCEAVTEPIQKCRRLNSHWMAAERRWCLHNGNGLRQLAMLLQRPVEKICRFLYQLTLKRFGEILNPKCSHWNWYRVPFVRPDTCGLYDNIFDRHGNLRNPLHPYILHILLTILDHYLDVPCQGYNGQRYTSMLDEICYGRSEGKCTDIFRADKDGIGARLREEWDASGLGYNFAGSDFDADADSDKDGRGKKGRDDDLVVDRRNKGQNDDDDAAGGGAGGAGGYGDRKSMKDISDLYARVVQNKHKRKLVESIVEEADDDGGKKSKKPKAPKVPKKKKYVGYDNRRYMGEMLPVLVHEPFDESKPWTWIRRHPMQTRVLEGTKLGRARVHRYKRPTLHHQFEKAKERYSTHSLYSLGKYPSVVWEDTFGKRSYMYRKTTMAKPFDYRVLKEKPEDTPARITIAAPPKKAPAKGKANPKAK
ncbi:hypothetical protein ACLKA7_002705 [Drosophila subpalustris]